MSPAIAPSARPAADRLRHLSVVAGTVALCVLTAALIPVLGIAPHLSLSATAGIVGASIALVLKILIAEWGNARWAWERHGNDMCTMAMGTSLTSLAAYAVSDHFDVHTMVALLALAAAALIFTLITGGNVRALDQDNNVTRGQALVLRWVNVGLGTIAIGGNLVIVVVKSL